MGRGESHEPLLTDPRIQFTEGKIYVPDDANIFLIDGDAIGPDIGEANVQILDGLVEIFI